MEARVLGAGWAELIVIAAIYIIPLAVGLYVLRLVIDFLRLSIAEMEGRARVRRDREPEAAEVRRAVALSLRECRERAGMTQELVAERLGVSRQAVSKWENGVADPSTANLVALAELFGVDVGDLLRGIALNKGTSEG